MACWIEACLKVRGVLTSQSLVGASQPGRQGQLGLMGAALSPGERETGSSGQQMNRDLHRLMMNPAITGLPSKRHSAIGKSRGSNTKVARWPEIESKKFKVAPESMSADTGLERPWRRSEIRKETSE